MVDASIFFRYFDLTYSNELLNHAKQLFTFADKYKVKYDNNIVVAHKYYASKIIYAYGLLWAVAWLHEATRDLSYMNHVIDNITSLGGT